MTINTTQMKFINTGLFFLFILLSGFWVSRTGKPYNAVIFNVHKLIGLAAGVFLIVTVCRIHKATPLEPQQIGVLVMTVLVFVLLVAAGGLLSAEAEGGLQNLSQSVLTVIALIHKTFPYLAVLSTGVTLYLLLFRKA